MVILKSIAWRFRLNIFCAAFLCNNVDLLVPVKRSSSKDNFSFVYSQQSVRWQGLQKVAKIYQRTALNVSYSFLISQGAKHRPVRADNSPLTFQRRHLSVV